ncbi:MAG TPA: hypothetical protein V6D02_03295 [Candidatus Obscuribacterales bacterium]
MSPHSVTFQVETVDGYQLGRLGVPLADVAEWLNFLVTPHYRAAIVAAEQEGDRLSIYFEANDGLYSYLEHRLATPWALAAA